MRKVPQPASGRWQNSGATRLDGWMRLRAGRCATAAGRMAALVALVALAACGSEEGEDGKIAGGLDIQYTDAGPLLPPKPTVSLCQPCHASVQCNGADDAGAAKCVDYGDIGAFCGRSCTTATDCGTEGYQCQDVKSVEGAASKQCVYVGKGSAPAACTCSAWSAAKGLTTQCIATVPGPSGKDVQCAGTRLCTAAGLTACSAPAATAEVCDGQDNDCDGQTDEDTCTDAPVCKKGVCHMALGCKFEQIAGTCDDNDACTKDDACFDGGCKGQTLICDDGNPCTKETCDVKTGCAKSNLDDAPCDNGEACSVNDVCKNGSCQAGPAKNCDDGNACTVDLCHKASGDCINSETTDPCDDGNPCTVGDACKTGACAPGAAKSCDDKLPCTTDSCDPKSGNCVSLPEGVTKCDK